ncbi:hypothetical protein [Streptomyces sp. NPDC001508]|uniref:hypothetical protein n=1 Tax=Streptomyces sp. NPDC001508 TaxID=3154656 RepID=UPI003330BB6B
MPAHGARAALVALAALAAVTLSGCHDGTGLRDEGPSDRAPATARQAPAAGHLADADSRKAAR